jgi:AcrR family transcriptional regulator
VRVKTEEKRQAIVAAAREAFLKKGYATASMAEISASLGGSKATLYSYFSSKEQLFAAVIAELAGGQGWGPLLNELEHAADFQRALGVFAHKTVRLLCSPDLIDFRRMIIAEGGRSDLGKFAYEKGPKPTLKRLADLLAAQMRLGYLRDADPWGMAIHLQGLCMAGLHQLLLEGVIDHASDKQLAAEASAVVNAFLRGYGVQSGGPGRTRSGHGRKRK